MSAPSGDFLSRFKTLTTGAPDTPLILLGNFEVEQQWGRDQQRLPRFSSDGGVAVVNAMDEFAVLLAGPGDHVVLRSAPDPDHLEYLREVAGGVLPTVHVAAPADPAVTLTEAVLADQALLGTLAELATEGAFLTPHGVSTDEQQLAARTGLPMTAPGAAICRPVNSKVYSRRLADETGIRQPHGWTCESVSDLEELLPEAHRLLAAGERLVIKEAFGVSGKGLAVLDTPQRLDRMYRMISKRAGKEQDEQIAYVVEQWVAKQADLNYQCTVGVDGTVHFDFVKVALTENGVHKGHLMPAGLTDDQYDAVVSCAETVGKRLAADGYYGVIGVDALVEPDGGLYPVLEINARNNMSTYQARLQERFVAAGQHAMARHYALRLERPVRFADVRDALGDLLLTSPGGRGVIVNNFATANAAALPGTPFDGRIYGVVVAGTVAEIDEWDAGIMARLRTVNGVSGDR
jgi:phosphoribosylaminoimidazole carboxylase (NCAIR synthetase)